MAELSKKHVNQVDVTSWHKQVEGSKGSIVLDGALFAHTDPARVYLMTESSGPSVRFELNRSDILDVTELSESVVFANRPFQGVRIVLRLDTMVTRMSIHLVSGLVEYPDATIKGLSGETMKIKNTVLAAVIMR